MTHSSIQGGEVKSQQIWLSTAQASERSGRHQHTVRRACESGEVHGNQRKVGASWRIHLDCLDAWVQGVRCPHESASR